jgi:hypothetical protein
MPRNLGKKEIVLTPLSLRYRLVFEVLYCPLRTTAGGKIAHAVGKVAPAVGKVLYGPLLLHYGQLYVRPQNCEIS